METNATPRSILLVRNQKAPSHPSSSSLHLSLTFSLSSTHLPATRITKDAKWSSTTHHQFSCPATLGTHVIADVTCPYKDSSPLYVRIIYPLPIALRLKPATPSATRPTMRYHRDAIARPSTAPSPSRMTTSALSFSKQKDLVAPKIGSPYLLFSVSLDV